MKLLYDIDSQPEFLVEEYLNEATGKTGKKYRIKGVFSTIGEKNRNGRVYPSHIWEKEIAGYQGNFTNGSSTTLMEWQHPARTNVDPMLAVAKIEKLEIQGNKVIGEAVLLDNPQANQLKSLIDNGIKISVSSRGVGSVKNGIVEDFKLVTYDIVDQPSDYNATMNGMVESFQLNEGVIEDMNFKVDERGNISKVCTEDGVCHMFEQEEIHDAIKSKFADALAELFEARGPKPFIKKADGFNYAVQIDGLDNEFPSYPFGRQLSDIKKLKEWKKDAKKGYVGAKGKATMTAVKAWIKDNKPSEFYAKWKPDSSSYKDDSVEIFYKD